MSHPQPNYHKGQALVEFTLVLPLLVLILLAVFLLGKALYTASNTSSAVKQPVLNKLALAQMNGDATATAQTQANSYRDPLFRSSSSLDSFEAINTNPKRVTALLVGVKNYDPVILPWNPPIHLNLTFTAVQAINNNLLQPNTGPMIESGAWQRNTPPALTQAPYINTVIASQYGLDQRQLSNTLQSFTGNGNSIKMLPEQEGCNTTTLDIVGIINRLATSDSSATLTAVPTITAPPPTALDRTFPTVFDGTTLYQLASASESSLALPACNDDHSYNVTCGTSDNNDACHHKQRMACRMAYINQYFTDLVAQMGRQHGCTRTAEWLGDPISTIPYTFDRSNYLY